MAPPRALKPRDRYENLPPPAPEEPVAAPSPAARSARTSAVGRFLRRLRRLVVFVVLVAALGYLALCAGVFFLQRQLLYVPPEPPSTAALERAGIRRVTRKWMPLHVLHRPAPPAQPTLVWFHGNAEQLIDLVPLADAVAARGLGFFAVEYPGYGQSPGNPTEESLYAAAEEGLGLLSASGVSAEQTVLCGQSLGSGVAVEMARRVLGARLILVSPYTSVADVARQHFPWLPVELLIRDRFDSRQKAAGLRQPALVVHGSQDEVIPVEQGRALAAALAQAELWELPAGHNDVLVRGGNALLDALARHARDAAPPAPTP